MYDIDKKCKFSDFFIFLTLFPHNFKLNLMNLYFFYAKFLLLNFLDNKKRWGRISPMDKTTLILEAIGYIGSFLVIVSMLMTSVVKLRIINTIGSTIFCGYALCIHSYPTAAMQLCLIVINIVNLYKLNNTKKVYSAVNVKADDGFLKYFFNENGGDIKKFFPDFQLPNIEDKIYLITCDSTPAGVFVAKEGSDLSTLNVKLDYVVPAYRDCSAGKFLMGYIKSQGIKTLNAKSSLEEHQKYLTKIGFVPVSEGNTTDFVRKL